MHFPQKIARLFRAECLAVLLRWRSVFLSAARASALLLALSGLVRAEPVALPDFRIALDETSVSGLSSGGFMAVQFSVAHASIMKGAGIVAGGPFYCARGDVNVATRNCSCTGLFAPLTCEVTPGGTRVRELVAVTQAWANEGKVDPVHRLAAQRIWLFGGTIDSVVPPPVMQDLEAYYRQFIPAAQLRFVNSVRAEHALPTTSFGHPCDRLGSPYINDCDLDAAGELLSWIYGALLPPQAPTGRLIEFDQSEFVSQGTPAAYGLAATGYAYVPPACEPGTAGGGAQCRLHIAFHGCKQNVANVGDQFIRQAGYNVWADANRLIVLYPQTQAKPSNPNACWNWFDFDDNDPDYANKRGKQMQAIRAMVDRVAGVTLPPALPLPRCFTASNAEHVRQRRAYSWYYLVRARGSDQILGFGNTYSVTTLRQTAPGYYLPGSCS